MRSFLALSAIAVVGTLAQVPAPSLVVPSNSTSSTAALSSPSAAAAPAPAPAPLDLPLPAPPAPPAAAAAPPPAPPAAPQVPPPAPVVPEALPLPPPGPQGPTLTGPATVVSVDEDDENAPEPGVYPGGLALPPAGPLPPVVAIPPPTGPSTVVVVDGDDESAPEPGIYPGGVLLEPQGPPPAVAAPLPPVPPPWTTSGTPPGPGAIPPPGVTLPDLSYAAEVWESGDEASSPKLSIASPPGAYSVALIEDPIAFPNRTVYVPQGVPPNTPVPIVAWENGASFKYGRQYQGFLTELASHGYLIVAPGSLNKQDWGHTNPHWQLDSVAFARNWRNAPFQIDVSKVALAGHGSGASETLWNLANVEPFEITTGILMNQPVIPWAFNEVGAPVLLVSGGETDAYEVSDAAFDFIVRARPELPAALISLETGHLGSFGLPRGGIYGETVKRWLDYQLKSDPVAKAFFVGGTASPAAARGWKIQTNSIAVPN